MAVFGQFLLLLKKNWILQKRKPIATALEILLPTLFSMILIIIRQVVEVEHFNEPTTWEDFTVDQFRDDLIPYSSMISGLPTTWKLYYAPINNITESIMAEVATRLDLRDIGFATEEAMLDFVAVQNLSNIDVLGGVVFNTDLTEGGTMAEKITYTIRMKSEQYFGRGGTIRIVSASDWFTTFLFPMIPGLGPRQLNQSDGGLPGYYREGFLPIQRAVDLAIIHRVNTSATPDNVGFSMQRFPFPTYIRDPYILVLSGDLPGVILLSFIVAAPNIVKDLVLEKERKLRETMKMMGLKIWLNWLAWFAKYLMLLLISVALMTFFFCIDFGEGAIINHSDPTVVVVFLFLYAISTIMFCFMVSAFFNKANSGAAAGGILFLVTYIPFTVLKLPGIWETLEPLDKYLSSLISNTAMALGCVQLAMYEVTGVGVQWHNVGVPLNVDDDFTMADTFLMLVVDSVMYGLITWYVDAVKPGDFGLPQPFYFPFTKSYWCGSSITKVEHISDEVDYGTRSDLFEEDSSNQEAGIKIRKLTKEFSSGGQTKVAVNEMYMDIYQGHITALLGHNGAGKTTTIFMLTGFMPPSAGTAYVNGFDIRTDIGGVRESLGLCPQHDVLFDKLTVREHLEFFAQLKGCDRKDVEAEVAEMIRVLKLEDKTNTLSFELSGGMKRKLSVGIALVGGSKTVILDEPTSGMDPEARRAMWDILQSQRGGRTMILTTHFMDEADFLGDRIAIMADGVVQCCGSSLFLKKKYGVGYHMVMVKSPACDTDQITNIITSYVQDAKLESNISAELSYALPSESSDRFEGLFAHIEKNKDELGILSFGASVTTMEEVFLKVGEEMDEDLKDKLEHVKTTEHKFDTEASYDKAGYIDGYSSTDDVLEKEENNMHNLPPAFGVEFERNTGFKLYMEQFYAMLIKRIIHSWRNKLVTITQLLVPFVFTLIGCGIIQIVPGPRDAPAADLGLYQYREPESPYQTVDYSGGINIIAHRLAQTYSTFLQPNVSVQYINDMDGYSNETGMERYLADQGESDLGRYRQSIMTAAVFTAAAENVTNVTGWFNNEAYHTPATSLNVISNTLLQYYSSSTSRRIRTVNHPLPRAINSQLEQDINTSTIFAFLVSFYVYFGMCFMIATFIIFLIKERSSKSKHIQFVSGVHAINYWLSTFIWDFVNYLIPCFLLLIVFAIFGIEPYYQGATVGYMLLIFVAFGWASLPGIYMLSFGFDVPANGYVWTTVINIFSGTVALLVVGILLVPDLGVVEVGEIMNWVFLFLLPNYCFGIALQDLYINFETKNICGNIPTDNVEEYCRLLAELDTPNPCCADNCGDYCVDIGIDYLAWNSPGVGRAVSFLTMQGLIYFTVLFFIESGFGRRLKNRILSGSATPKVNDEEVHMSVEGHTAGHMDSDVYEEKKRVQDLNVQDASDMLILRELGKVYNGSFLAVDSVSLGVPSGECFGLLGVNGAGKTSTFKMLTGDETVTFGDAFVNRHSIIQDIKEVQQQLGYCPQFDALIEQMTVRETLRMYARLRGVKEEDIFPLVDALIEQLLLGQYKDKQAGTLSGGNKRKLSTAIALVGEPPIVFLDEPTTGMDPVARRLLWDTLSKFRLSGRTLLLTSHSMEECEALCTRMTIMVNGQFKCLGSPQYLKNKFGEGYTVLAKVRDGSYAEVQTATENLRRFIETTFPGSIIKDLHHGYVHYQVPRSNLSWATIFGRMERAREEFHIEDYSVSQTTLEQVFLNFARVQKPPVEVEVTCFRKSKTACNYFCCCGCCKDDTVNHVAPTETVPAEAGSLIRATTAAAPANGTNMESTPL